MGAHARFSPSAANRLIHCPPSLVLGEAFQEEESPYAAEGSAGQNVGRHAGEQKAEEGAGGGDENSLFHSNPTS